MATAPATNRLPNIKGWVYDDEDSYCRVEDEEGREMVTDAYDPTATYTQGATCIQDNKLYRAKADITTAEIWTPDHWEGTSLEQIRKDMAAEISSLNAKNVVSVGSNQITQDVLAGYASGFWIPIVVPDNYKIVGVGLVEIAVPSGLEKYIVMTGFSYSNDRKAILINVVSLAQSSTISVTITAYGICAPK